MQALRRPIDTTALTAPVHRREVRRSWRALVAAHPEARDLAGAFRRLVLGFATFTAPIALLAFALIVWATLDDGGPDVVQAVVVQSVLGGLLLLAGVVCGWAWLRLRRRRPRPRVHHRLMGFAAANGLSYSPGPTSAAPGAPLRLRGALNLYRVLRSPDARGVEFANYELLNSTMSNTSPQFGGYCALRLPVALPNILLRSLDGPRRPLHTSAALPDSQVLSLEGDFDRYFRLYCPEGYERDALYLFTPDVMGRLVDHLRGLDVEIVDDWLYLISARDLVTDSAERWQALAAAVDALDDRIDRWARWRDDRAARGEPVPRADGSADGSARRLATQRGTLRTTWSLGTILIVGFVTLCFVGLLIAINLG
ncbi:hypothetical protein NVV95_17160 [Herbiconiux sp. CPCC 205716]|uniref:DUF3137 domain-containing protein n=1 Tax=Herbiconiux gentiana TaxID=2970912 RepID=A0ABT2GJ95_9MICO|nr:hypothetical protein [Herbiconiux gentiana]MCS5716279.1 hypothetical protein [Herbiconiux gentiana]